MPPPSRLSSLTLVHLLQEWVPVEEASARQDTAERLGEWLSAFDSVKLDGALQAIASYARQARQRGEVVDASPLAMLCQQVQSELRAQIIDKAARTPSSTNTGNTGTAANDGADAAAVASYGPHLQCYVDLQKQMAAKVAACRDQVRQALGKGTPTLRQLAALDGVMAQMLGEREQKLLAALPLYLERRFEHWRQASSTQAAWLDGFQQDMKQMLQAELHVRLQPVLGLIEAAQHAHQHLQQA